MLHLTNFMRVSTWSWPPCCLNKSIVLLTSQYTGWLFIWTIALFNKTQQNKACHICVTLTLFLKFLQPLSLLFDAHYSRLHTQTQTNTDSFILLIKCLRLFESRVCVWESCGKRVPLVAHFTWGPTANVRASVRTHSVDLFLQQKALDVTHILTQAS